jgi:Fe-S cluster assembly iron-binding protein IscA
MREGSFLRVAVKVEAAGLSYGMGFVQDAEGSLQFEQHGIKVVVDKRMLLFTMER